MPMDAAGLAPAIRAALRAGVEGLGLALSPAQFEQLCAYLVLLERWNSAYNLTAVRDPLDMVHRHLLDSLAVLPWIDGRGARFIDVGTGGGLPGVALAIARPDLEFDLLDSNGKKCRFLFQVKTALGLANMSVRHSRAESWQPASGYDVVISRAFASLANMASSCAHLCASGGVLLAMKGRHPELEIEDLPGWASVSAVHRILVPGLAEQRHLVELQLAPQSINEDETGKLVG